MPLSVAQKKRYEKRVSSARRLYGRGTSINEISRLFGVNRATAFRWVEDLSRSKSGRGEFWSKVRKGRGRDACWLWRGANTGAPSFYGRFRDSSRGKQILAHRYIYEKEFGAIPHGAIVMHICDNPRCVRPKHLKIGTQSENIMSAATKGRMSHGKLTQKQAEDIRQKMRSRKHGDVTRWAKEYGVSRDTLYDIALGRSYKRVLKK